MAESVIEIRGLDPVIARMQAYQSALIATLKTTVEASLLALWENVPEYPPPPDDSSYRRTGTLGRTLGGGMDGGQGGGKPDVYQVQELGQKIEGHFGTRLDYAPVVIGPGEQADMHLGRWWTLEDVAKEADDKIQALFSIAASKMAEYLDTKTG